MILTVERKYKKPTQTIGILYVNGKFFSNTLEDPDRGLNSDMSGSEIMSKKVYGKTAIPTGEYKVTLTKSLKFKKIMPYINNVKGFLGIRIHSGSNASHTDGCLLVGLNKEVGKLVQSKETYEKLYKILDDTINNKKEEVIIKIK